MSILMEINQSPLSMRTFILQKHLSDIAADYIGLSSDIDFSLGFYELGFTSVTSLEYIYALEASLAVKLTSDTLFNFPNINALRNHLINDKLINIDFGFEKLESKKIIDNELEQLIQSEAKNILKNKFGLF